MTTLYHKRLQLLEQSKNKKLLSGLRHGIEREALRVSCAAELSKTQHPKTLGKPLTHPYITTDFSEAQLEYITPVHCKIDDTLAFLEELHCYTAQHLNKELLWAGSMPCGFNDEDSIAIATYGQSNIGKMKAVYREGLSNRYGKAMQIISGIHYNWSLPKTIWPLFGVDQSQGYLALTRNFLRYSWILMYLFGASPAVSNTFFSNRDPDPRLKNFNCNTLYLPYSTSLRMSDMGYNNNPQSSLSVCYNSLNEYTTSLYSAMQMSYKDYKDIGIKVDGQYKQLNTNLLQIENEYYNTIRPKCIARSGEKPLTALRRRGVEYVEIRCIDINPFERLGINAEDAHFIDIFLTYCALQESKPISYHDDQIIKQNFHRVVLEGRRPALTLNKNGQAITLPVWGNELLNNMLPVARLLDSTYNDHRFSKSLDIQRDKFADPSKTPSAKVIIAMEELGVGYTDLMLKLSKQHHHQFHANPLLEERLKYFSQIAERSRYSQQLIEASDNGSFDAFLKNYELAD